MRKGNMARRNEGHRGGKFRTRRIERAHRSEEKTKSLNNSLHRHHLDRKTQFHIYRR
jgi:hypothetical protein